MDIRADPIAIIGVATKFPEEAETFESLWEFLLKGRSAWKPFPEDRIGSGHYHPDINHRGTHAVRGGHFLNEDPALFDAPFFNITRSELAALDPQQRLVLENVYHALENAGLTLSEVTGSDTSVYVSGFNHDHLLNLSVDPETHLKYRATGTTNSLLSNRVSWFYDLKGPSMTLDTACSSSMVSLHLACQTLLSGESKLSIVSGVTMISWPTDIVGMSNHGFLGPGGKSYSFDHRAEGYGRGEGVGSIVVKRLSNAIRDGNTIRAIIRATALNQDGRTPGISLPSTEAQVKLIRRVYESAGLDPRDTLMVEAHGTGTAAGDPIEAAALARSFPGKTAEAPLVVGSLKSSIGHLEGGAGVAGIIKSVLILENGIIPPNANFEKPNPRIPVHKWHLKFPTTPTPWPTNALRRISVNSFGVGGTNGHAVLDDAYNYLTEKGLHGLHNTRLDVPTLEELHRLVSRLSGNDTAMIDRNSIENKANGHMSNGHGSGRANGETNGYTNGSTDGRSHENPGAATKPPTRFILLTANDEQGVERNALKQASYLQAMETPKSEEAFLQSFAHTLNKRTRFPWRSFAIGGTVAEVISSLKSHPKQLRVKSTPSLGFVFTGQGAQWHAMGRELLEYPVFEQSLRRADEYYKSLGATWSLMEEMARSRKDTNVSQPWLAHPACTALQMAMVDLLRSWDVVPKRVVGHSSGEIAAAYCAGLLSCEAAWRAAYFRGVVSGKQLSAKGSMMAVGLSQEELIPYVKRIKEDGAGELTIACINSPKNCTVSGDEHKVDALREVLDQNNVFARTLQVMNAYHSSHMKEVADDYLSHLGILPKPSGKPPKPIEYFSSLTGMRVDDTHLPATYWVENLVSPVRFSEGLHAMMAGQVVNGQASLKLNSASRGLSIDTLLEIGPHAALQSAIKECAAARPDAATISSFGLLDRRNANLANVLASIGQLCIRGYPVNLSSLNQIAPTQEPRVLTQLPGYSFNHSERHIAETRIARNFRLRKEPRHDLFGAPVPDWNEETPRWRQYYTVEEQPWLRDHQITNSIVFPAVGYLVAAIEAIRQISNQSESKITGYRLRDVNLKRAMVLQDDSEGVEATLSFTRMDESSLWGSPTWRRFSLQSYNPVSDDWIEHCTGYISVEMESADGPIDEGRERRETAAIGEATLKEAEGRCVVPVDVEATYENLGTCGIGFGPTFRNLTSIWNTGSRLGKASGIVSVPDIASTMPYKFLHEHVIHPATFDSMLQLFFLSLMDLEGRKTLSRPIVPTFIKECWVSAEHPSSPGGKYFAHSNTKGVAYDKFEANVTAYDASSRDCRVQLRGIRTSYLESMDSQDINSRALCHELTWTPHLESLTSVSLANIGILDGDENEKYRDQVRRFQTASIILVLDALQELGDVTPESFEGHFRRYFQWMLQVRDWHELDEASGTQRSFVLDIAKDPEAKKKLLEDVAADNADGELAVRMGSHIVPVLKKEIEPLHLMFGQDDLMDRVYGQMARLGDLPALQAEYLKAVALNKTNLRILEIGAGTGGSTVAILNELTSVSPDGHLVESHVKNYTFTDISAGFFEKAKHKLAPYADFMEYRVLDAEKDITEQPFELGSYDFIVAQNVIHATTNLQYTLGNVRKLLKPGGYLLLQEGVRQDFFWSGIAFGQLPGWWAGEESFRPWSPWIPVPRWDECLRAAGYTGIELNMADRSTPDLHTQSIFVARSDKTINKSQARVAIVTTQPLEEGLTQLVRQIKARLEQDFGLSNTAVLHLLDLASADIKDTVCLSVMELERPVLEGITAEEFDNFRQMISVCKGMLWVTGDPLQRPGLDMISGIARTNRWERDVEDANLVTLHIGDDEQSQAGLVEHVLSLYRRNFLAELPPRARNGEFLVRDGVVYTSRLVAGQGADDFLASKFSKPKPVAMPMKEAGRPLKLSIAAPGLLDKLEWVTDEGHTKPLGETEVEVETKAVGLNFRDLMIAMGEYMASAFGVEAAGVVRRVGSGVDKVKVGDRVLYVNGRETVGAFQQFGRSDQNFVVRIPDELDYETAAGLPCVYSTVMYGLDHAARLERGEKVLIHAAAGGVGQAAIQFAQYVGAEVFATVSSSDKRELLMKEYGIPKDHIFSSRDQIFVKGVLRMTEGRGVDVVLNSLAGESLRNSWEILAPLGRFIEIGKKDAQAHGKISLAPFLNNVSMSSVELPTIMRHRPTLIRSLVERTVELWKDGHIKAAVPTTTMPFSQAKEALRILQAGKGMGKIVMVPSPDDAVPIVPEQRGPYRMRAEASYVIGGGLGGLGRSLAAWMADRGARNLILLSRSGRITDEVTETLSLLRAKGCNVRICKCDVSQRAELQKVLEECASTMPPIKGVIQGAMTLDDGMFENMSYSSFQTAVRPKVSGSRNLHELLPADVDFFVMLSSATGILGNRSQGNYAAGNTYQDALARHRRARGLRASTVDLGTVLSVGYAAKNRHRMRIARHLGTVLESLREDEIHALVEYCMDPDAGPPAQLVTGLAAIGSYHAKGLPPPTFMEYPLFTNLTTVTASRSGCGKASKEVLVEALLSAATTYEGAAAVVQKAIIAKLSGLLAIPEDSIDPKKSVSSNGLDSLVAMEFRAFLSKEVKADVPVLDIMGSLSLEALAQKIAGISQAVSIQQDNKAADSS